MQLQLRKVTAFKFSFFLAGTSLSRNEARCGRGEKQAAFSFGATGGTWARTRPYQDRAIYRQRRTVLPLRAPGSTGGVSFGANRRVTGTHHVDWHCGPFPNPPAGRLFLCQARAPALAAGDTRFKTNILARFETRGYVLLRRKRALVRGSFTTRTYPRIPSPTGRHAIPLGAFVRSADHD
jgi:hypothetical protein